MGNIIVMNNLIDDIKLKMELHWIYLWMNDVNNSCLAMGGGATENFSVVAPPIVKQPSFKTW